MTGVRAKAILLFVAVFAGYMIWTAAVQPGGTGQVCEIPVVIEVLNGCGHPGIAERVSEMLRDHGFDVMFIGNADDFDHVSTLVVDRSGDRSKALAVARVLDGASVIYQTSSSTFVDATVIIGSGLAGALAGNGLSR
jgi:hypothetical protein